MQIFFEETDQLTEYRDVTQTLRLGSKLKNVMDNQGFMISDYDLGFESRVRIWDETQA